MFRRLRRDVRKRGVWLTSTQLLVTQSLINRARRGGALLTPAEEDLIRKIERRLEEMGL